LGNKVFDIIDARCNHEATIIIHRQLSYFLTDAGKILCRRSPQKFITGKRASWKLAHWKTLYLIA